MTGLTDSVSEFQAAIDDVMTEFGCTCRVDRLAASTYDYGTSAFAPGAATEIYSGLCLFNAAETKGVVAGDADATMLQNLMTLRLPVSAALPAIGDRVTITAAPLDPGSVGSVWWVAKTPVGSAQASRQVLVSAWRQEPHEARG